MAHPEHILWIMGDFVYDTDVDEIKKDSVRCEEFVQLCAALKAFVGDDVYLPDSSTLLEIFGKVGFVQYVFSAGLNSF